MSIPQGWQCPKCGKIHSPSAMSCNACSKNSMYDFIVAPEKMPLSWGGERRGHDVWELVRLYQKHMDSGRSQESLNEFRATLQTLAKEEASARPFGADDVLQHKNEKMPYGGFGLMTEKMYAQQLKQLGVEADPEKEAKFKKEMDALMAAEERGPQQALRRSQILLTVTGTPQIEQDKTIE